METSSIAFFFLPVPCSVSKNSTRAKQTNVRRHFRTVLLTTCSWFLGHQLFLPEVIFFPTDLPNIWSTSNRKYETYGQKTITSLFFHPPKRYHYRRGMMRHRKYCDAGPLDYWCWHGKNRLRWPIWDEEPQWREEGAGGQRPCLARRCQSVTVKMNILVLATEACKCCRLLCSIHRKEKSS